MKKLRILLVDDHVVVREGLRRIIESEGDMEVTEEAADGDAAVEIVSRTQIDVAVLDISMLKMNGPEAARKMMRICPSLKILGLSVHEHAAYIREMVEAGAIGYVLKRAAREELVQAVRAIADGGLHIDPRVTSRFLLSIAPGHSASAGDDLLSDREADVLQLIARGYSNKEIASRLEVSVKTIETYKSRGMEKLGLHSRVDIVSNAAARGWLKESRTAASSRTQ